jgi:hypothetical protein
MMQHLKEWHILPVGVQKYSIFVRCSFKQMKPLNWYSALIVNWSSAFRM